MNKERIIEYLYGEMSVTEKNNFQREMTEDGELMNEVTQLQSVRQFLGQSVDEETQPAGKLNYRLGIRSHNLKWWAMAASVILVLGCAFVFDLRISLEDQQLVIGFGEVSRDDVDKQAILSQYARLESQLSKLQAQVVNLPVSVTKSGQSQTLQSDVSEERWMNLIANTIRQNQTDLENRIANKILEDQQIYLHTVAQDLIKYWDTQRTNDLQVINNGLRSLAEAVQLSPRDMVQFVNNNNQ